MYQHRDSSLEKLGSADALRITEDQADIRERDIGVKWYLMVPLGWSSSVMGDGGGHPSNSRDIMFAVRPALYNNFPGKTTLRLIIPKLPC